MRGKNCFLMKSMGCDRLIRIILGGYCRILVILGGSNLANWNSRFSTNQHMPAMQEKVTIKPTSCIEQDTEARQPSVHQKLKCP